MRNRSPSITRNLPRTSLACFALAAILVQSPLTIPMASAEPNDFATVVSTVLQKHCVQCHGADDVVEGETNLNQLTYDALKSDAELVRNLIEVLDQREMPPEDEPPLDAEVRRQLVAKLQDVLHDAVSSGSPFPHSPIRRMNRFQYNNAVTDLFDLKCIVFTLPERMMREHKGYFKPETEKMADVVTVGSRPLGKSQMIEPRLAGVAAFPQDLRAEHGFDNRGDHLSLSPLLMDAFLKLGQSVTQSPDFNAKNVGIWNTFFAAPETEAERSVEVRNRLEPFLRRAFRRPPEEALIKRYADFVDKQIDSGVPFTEAMRSVAAATISSPRFLYLYDASAPTETTLSEKDSTVDKTLASATQITDLELATRLSFFLWGSIPDERLLELAMDGSLSDAKTLNAEVDRILHDRKLKRFCDSFPSQWLQLERIVSSVPNPEKYPDFFFLKYRDSMHMMLEPLLLFETVLIENQSITQLIDSEFTYRSTLLEEAYGELGNLPEGKKGGSAVTVLNFHRVPVTDRRSGGVMTNAAVMTMTSGPERTQPITRGAWVAGVIFNDPPKPPPADVPPLVEKPPEGEEQLTLRERLTLHRERADCKGCHEQIDPLGFALENYNPVGKWRDQYENGRDVDSAGTLFRQHEFNDVVEFKDAILAEKDRFTRGLAGHLLSYGLARGLNAADQPALDKIAEVTAEDGYRIQTLIKQVILSEPFQSKTDSTVSVSRKSDSQTRKPE